MAEGPIVAVRGDAYLEVEPEIARFRLRVEAHDRDRDRAVEALQRRTQAVSVVLDGFGEAVERTETTSLRVQPRFKEGRPGEKVIGFMATTSLSVTVSDTAQLGPLATALAREEMVTIDGPEWALRRDSDVHRQARVAAARDAITRASQYAGAVGATITRIIELADVGLLGEGPPDIIRAARAAAPAARGPGGASAEPRGFDFEPVRQVVRARVDARFVMSEPDLTR